MVENLQLLYHRGSPVEKVTCCMYPDQLGRELKIGKRGLEVKNHAACHNRSKVIPGAESVVDARLAIDGKYSFCKPQ